MKKYENLLILINYVLILVVLFFPKSILIWGVTILFGSLLTTYFVSDNKDQRFLNKIKYNYVAYVLGFFIFRDFSSTNEIQQLGLDFSKVILIVSAVFLTYILLRIDRLNKNVDGVENV